MGNYQKSGLYTIKDKYFRDFESDYWVDNKQENRPCYYLFSDKDGIFWMIPMSTQVDNYKEKIKKIEEKRGEGNCIYYHIGLVAGVERVFLIGDMFPVSDEYIKSPYIINHIPYVCRNNNLVASVHSKGMRYLRLVEQGVMKSRNDILGIRQALLNRKQNSEYIV